VLAATFAVLPLAGCDGRTLTRGESLPHPSLQYYKNQTPADQCLNRKLEELGRIDHETPIAPTVDALVAFCSSQYPSTGGAQP
jgi:hypothetical protein